MKLSSPKIKKCLIFSGKKKKKKEKFFLYFRKELSKLEK